MIKSGTSQYVYLIFLVSASYYRPNLSRSSSLLENCRFLAPVLSFAELGTFPRVQQSLSLTMFPSSVISLILLSLFQYSTYGSPIQPRSANAAVITTNFMDPSVIEVNGGYYAFGGANGNPAGINVQVASSLDFSAWTLKSGYDALPNPGPWAASPPHVWSPDINQLVG